METADLFLVTLLAVAAIVFVARPFLGLDAVPELAEDPAALERIRGAEVRDRALAALKELEFDHRTGKISEGDYRELVGPLRREAAAALVEDRDWPEAVRRRRVGSRRASSVRARALGGVGGR